MRSIFFLILAAFTLASCADKISSLGAPYYSDTIQFRTTVRTDSGFVGFMHTTDTFATANGSRKSLTYESPYLIVGRATGGTENVESWAVLHFPIISTDTLNNTIGIKLILKSQQYRYGDTNSTNLDLQVFAAPPGNGKVSDSMTTILQSDLSANRIDSLTPQTFADTSNATLTIPIDSSIKSYLGAASFAFVIEPGASMTNMRAFDAMESGNQPQLALTYRVSTDSIITIYRTPTFDMHIVHDQSTAPAGEFSLRGSLGARERVLLHLNRPTDTLQLNPFSTVNSAVLVLKLDPANSRKSNVAGDTLPMVVKVAPTGDTLDAIGYPDPTDPTLIRFQIRALVESWLRIPSQNFGFDLRAGFVTRTFPGPVNIGVEDNTINRWTFYGQDNPDPAKRPQLILTYSRLP